MLSGDLKFLKNYFKGESSWKKFENYWFTLVTALGYYVSDPNKSNQIRSWKYLYSMTGKEISLPSLVKCGSSYSPAPLVSLF